MHERIKMQHCGCTDKIGQCPANWHEIESGVGYGESGDRDGRGATVVRLFVEKVVAEQEGGGDVVWQGRSSTSRDMEQTILIVLFFHIRPHRQFVLWLRTLPDQPVANPYSYRL